MKFKLFEKNVHNFRRSDYKIYSFALFLNDLLPLGARSVSCNKLELKFLNVMNVPFSVIKINIGSDEDNFKNCYGVLAPRYEHQ